MTNTSENCIKAAIKNTVEDNGTTWAQIARDLEIPYITMRKWKDSSKGSIEIAAKILEYLNLSIVEIKKR